LLIKKYHNKIHAIKTKLILIEVALEQETMQYDVVIVGAGPAGLAAAIRLKQLALKYKTNIKVCVLEKAAQIGGHILAGAILEPESLQQLLPRDWQTAPLQTPIFQDNLYYLSKKHKIKLPTHKFMSNSGNYLVSLGELSQFLARKAENLGCEIYAGFAASEVLYSLNGDVIGVQIKDAGIDKNGHKTENYQPGIKLYARQTLLAEGCRGYLSEQVIDKFALRKNSGPQTYALGLKEVWEVSKKAHKPGRVMHTVGWPLGNQAFGGGFLYHTSNNQVSLGLVVGLDYKNPWLDPFEELQRFKTHPLIKAQLHGGERIAYGARALNEGGYHALPRLSFPGGSLLGDSAGFVNIAKLKGIAAAIESGMLAASTSYTLLHGKSQEIRENVEYEHKMRRSVAMVHLHEVRNIRQGFQYGLFPGLALAALELYVSHGKGPWTLKHNFDHQSLIPAASAKKITYPKPDDVLTFSKEASLMLTSVAHNADQPAHLKVLNQAVLLDLNQKTYASPETRYCPAKVYEMVADNLVINAQNCLHCKACDIKDPGQTIKWTTPESGGGPNYVGM
jgi:electron-transferring-flavoprotein dehydrogenase